MISTTAKATLHSHRTNLSQVEPIGAEWNRLLIRLIDIVWDEDRGRNLPYIRSLGHRRFVEKAARMISVAQNQQPFFWISADLPFCWNHPKDWNLSFIKYEWGHLIPKHGSNYTGNPFENLCLMSARCNNHLQSSLSMAELLSAFSGSAVGDRIAVVLSNRDELFRSVEWRDCMSALRDASCAEALPRITLEMLGLGSGTDDSPPPKQSI